MSWFLQKFYSKWTSWIRSWKTDNVNLITFRLFREFLRLEHVCFFRLRNGIEEGSKILEVDFCLSFGCSSFKKFRKEEMREIFFIQSFSATFWIDSLLLNYFLKLNTLFWHTILSLKRLYSLCSSLIYKMLIVGLVFKSLNGWVVEFLEDVRLEIIFLYIKHE